MHPLSWNVYGGHYESIKLLLESGAQVNADVDSGDGVKITVLDICDKFLESNTDDDGENSQMERFQKVRKLLLQHGAKTFAEENL